MKMTDLHFKHQLGIFLLEWVYTAVYRDLTCFSMHIHLLDPEGGVETRAGKVKILLSSGV